MHVARKLAAALVAGAVIAAIPSTDAAATLPSTKVTPAGDYVKLKLASGFDADLGGIFCEGFVFKPVPPLGTTNRNKIPTADNPSASGPVVIALRAPIVSGCSFSSASATATASGLWKAVLQHKPTGNFATVKVPKGGLIAHTTIGGMACTATFSPTGITSLPGTWTNGTPSQLVVDHAAIDTLATGTGCPMGIFHTTVSFTLDVTDVSDPGSNVTVS